MMIQVVRCSWSLLSFASMMMSMSFMIAMMLTTAVHATSSTSSSSITEEPSLSSSSSSSPPLLTMENYETLTAGKIVFLKFFAPWCGHCQKMAPAWEMLWKDWKDDDVGFVGQVDCTDDDNGNGGKALCQAHGISSFPTLKYGLTPQEPQQQVQQLERYQGGRTYEALRQFATQTLILSCSPFHLELCFSQEERETMMTILNQSSSVAELTQRLETCQQHMALQQEEFQTEVAKLQEEHDVKLKTKQEAMAEIINGSSGSGSDGSLSLMKMVRLSKMKMLQQQQHHQQQQDQDQEL